MASAALVLASAAPDDTTTIPLSSIETSSSSSATCDNLLIVDEMKSGVMRKTTTSRCLMMSDDESSSSDLDSLVYSIAMLIVEGRTPRNTISANSNVTTTTTTKSYLVKESVHATPTIDKLVSNMFKLSEQQQQQQQRDKSTMLNSSIKSHVKNINKSVSAAHICDDTTNQCRLATKLKQKIDQCIRDHHHQNQDQEYERLVEEYDDDELSPQQQQQPQSLLLLDANSNVVISSSSTPDSSDHHQLYCLKRRFHKISNKRNHHDHQSGYQTTSSSLSSVPYAKRVDSNNSLGFSSVESGDDSSSDNNTQTTSDLSSSSSSESARSESCVTIKVYLVPPCCHGQIRLEHGDNLIDLDPNNHHHHQFSGELLESWTITMISEKNNESSSVNISRALLSINGLFQAIRSYLHFSQISSWINQSRGSEPRHLAFSVSYTTSEKNLTTTTEIGSEIRGVEGGAELFEFHSFPTLSLVLLNNRFWASGSSSSSQSPVVATNTTRGRRVSTHGLFLRSNLIRVGLYSRKRNSFGGGGDTLTNSIGLPLISCSLSHQNSMEDHDHDECSVTKDDEDSLLLTGEFESITAKSSLKQSLMMSTPPPLQQQFYLPHWSSIMMTPGSSSSSGQQLYRRSSSIELNERHDNSDLANDLLEDQEKFHQKATSFLTFKDDVADATSSREENWDSVSTSSSSSSSAKHFIISQSPKVLVSNHQLELCTHATNNLKLDEQSAQMTDESESGHVSSSKRKLRAAFNQASAATAASAPPSNSKKFFPNDDHDVEFMEVVKEDESIDDHDDDLIRKLNNNPSVNFKKIGQEDDQTTTMTMTIKARLLPASSSLLPRRNYPLSSSPAPLRKSGSAFDFDTSLRNPKSIKAAFCVSSSSSQAMIDNNNNNSMSADENIVEHLEEKSNNSSKEKSVCVSSSSSSSRVQLSYSNANINSMIQLTPNRLLGSFEESLLNGRMNPVGVVDGFYAEIGASGSFFPEHVTLPVHTAFYQVCEDVAASPYLGVLSLASLGSKRGYKVPSKGTIQVTLFNPNNTVVKMFVVMYDLSDMPPGNKTFLRQRTMYVPLSSTSSTNATTSNKISQQSEESVVGTGGGSGVCLKSYLRYLIHLRFATSRSGKMYLHTNIKLIFARNKCEIDPRLARYEYKTFTEAPRNPKYSPKK